MFVSDWKEFKARSEAPQVLQGLIQIKFSSLFIIHLVDHGACLIFTISVGKSQKQTSINGEMFITSSSSGW